MTRTRLIIILQWLLFSIPLNRLSAQSLHESNFVRYTTAEGLSHNTVNAITQDPIGYIWAATTSGLNRYNGARFVQYHSNDDSLSLPAEELKGMAWLDKYRMAVFTAGIHIIDTRTGKTHNLFIPYHDKQYQYKFNMMEAVKGDEDGNIFILSRSGFYHFDKNYQLVSRFDYYPDSQVPYNHFFFGRDLLELDKQRFLIVSINGLYIYDKTKKAVHKMTSEDSQPLAEFKNYPGDYFTPYRFLQNKPGCLVVLKMLTDTLIYIDLKRNLKTVTHLPFDSIRKEFGWRTELYLSNDSTLYMTGHEAGFYKMTLNTVTGAVKFDPEKYFGSYLITSMLSDKDNNLWVGTNKGLLRQDAGMSQVEWARLPSRITDSVPTAKFDDIYVAGTKVYGATRGNGGLIVFDKSTLRFEKQKLFTGYDKRGNTITSLSAGDSHSMVLGTDWPILLFDWRTQRETQLMPPGWDKGDWTSDVCTDRKGNIWFGASIIYRFNIASKKFTSITGHPRLLTVPIQIEEDRDGNIWMSGHGLARYNTTVDSFDIFIDSFPAIKMMDKQINSMVIDQQNTIWFNSNNNGLTAYNINNKTFRHFTRNDGLPDNNMASMIVVGAKLWMATYSGIACLDMQSKQVVSFGKEDGFPDMPITRGARFFYDEQAGQLYIGFSNAIARFNPYEILKRKLPPRVFVENLSISGRSNEFLPADKITTSWRNNEIMITIGSINFSDSYGQRFAYRILDGENTQWQQLGSQPSFSISNLSPGNYRIQVKSFSLKNRWPEQIDEISIEVRPPFWQRTWFILLAAFALSILGYLGLQWRTDVARKKEMEKTQIEKLKADDYKNLYELEQITNYFSSSLADKKTVDDVLWDVANNLISRMNYVDCMLYLWNDDKTKMIQKAAYGPKGKPELISASAFDVEPGQGIVGHVVATSQPILIEDTRKDPRYRVDDAFRLSEICVPIIHNGELLGIIDSEHHEPAYFKERDIQILTTVATLIGNKLTQLKSDQSLEATHKEIAIINKELAEAQLSALQAQMNPHFVFNALNSIKRMILDGDNEKASRYLSKFALMIRMTLNHTKEIFVTLEENIEYLRAYLEMECLRFDDSFNYNIFTGENIETGDTVIPSLMIQPLVENAIWHGLMHVEGEKKIQIGFKQDDSQITCTIEDNGIGIRHSESLKASTRPLHKSVGLENLHKRIQIMNEKYDTGCSLEIADLKDGDINARGTLVVLRFNVINS
jgi:ligand-binding sensor domain-containing protein/putative methionine-R-sulfoxide reductase with GAF domain